MKIEIIPYKTEHAEAIGGPMYISDWNEVLEKWEKSGPAWTIIIEDKVVCCLGIILLGWNRGEAWMLTHPRHFPVYWRTVYKVIIRDLDLKRIMKVNKLKRVQAFWCTGIKAQENFTKHLGFVKEGILRKFGYFGENFTIGAVIEGD